MSASANTAGKAHQKTKQGPDPMSTINGTRRTGGTTLLSVEPPKDSDLQVLPPENLD